MVPVDGQQHIRRTILADTTLVRMVVQPAFMRVAGERN
jgi:hypothetical protein